jgi:hypothetical protein
VTALDLAVVPGILVAVFLFALLVIIGRYAWARTLDRHASAARSLYSIRAYRQLQDANDAIIAQLEADKSLAGFIPQDVRDEIYAAHEAASSTEGNGTEWKGRDSLLSRRLGRLH